LLKKNYSKYVFLAILLGLIILSLILLKPFIVSLISGIFLAYVLYPVYKIILARVKNKNFAASIMLLLILIVILVPMFFLANCLVKESSSIYQLAIEKLTPVYEKYFSSLKPYLSEITKNVAVYLTSIISGLIASVPKIIIDTIIVLFVLFFTFRDGKNILSELKNLFPLKKEIQKKISEKAKLTINGVIYGVLLTSIIEGILAIPGFYIFDVFPHVILGLVLGLVAILPGAGPATVWLPVVILKLLKGDIFNAIGLTIYCVIVLNLLIETLLKTKFISKKARVHPILILLGIICGLKFFGLIGAILGPLIFVITALVIDIYIRMHKD